MHSDLVAVPLGKHGVLHGVPHIEMMTLHVQNYFFFLSIGIGSEVDVRVDSLFSISGHLLGVIFP